MVPNDAPSDGPPATGEEDAGAPVEGRKPLPLLVFVTLGALALAAAFLALWVRDRAASPSEMNAYLREQSVEAAEPATRVIDALMTYDAESLAARREEIEPLTTDNFRADYDEVVTGGLDDALERTGATAVGDLVAGPDVAMVTATRALAIARVVQEVTTAERPEPRMVFYVVQVSLLLEGDEWLVDELEILSQQSS